MKRLRAQVVLIGGGIAGLWSLARLRSAGIDAVLLEGFSLGRGQTVQAQGIVHGGGKYALRKVGDRAAIEAIREMPSLWSAHFRGERQPDLRGAHLLSPQCWLWLPRGQWRARIEAMGWIPMLRHGGILHTPPRPRPRGDWPEALRRSALRAYSMDEPVFSTASVQAALAESLEDHLFAFVPESDDIELQTDDNGAWSRLRLRSPQGGEQLEVEASAFVLTAGEGNAHWIERAGGSPGLMQRRPLLMFLLRGSLPSLHGHCFLGGRTRMTVTSQDLGDGERVWQLGGEVAERHAETSDLDAATTDCRRQLRQVLPGWDFDRCALATYRAVRAERSRPDHRRPGGVQLERLGANVWAAWPTKWALAPVLADEIVGELRRHPLESEGVRPDAWPRPTVARPPWEEVSAWRNASSGTPV